MHRVLSYQTAMSASTGRDVREYVTKRTCVSLILTIAFFTLISGFLLGKFVADRQYHIRYFREGDVNLLKELIIARDAIHSSAQDIVKHSNSSVHNELNVSIYSKYMFCMKNDSIAYNSRIDEFVEKYLLSKIPQQGVCFTELSEFLRNNERNP